MWQEPFSPNSAAKKNKLTYRQLLDKHSAKIAPLCGRFKPWMVLSCYCMKVTDKDK
ncbi:hypothetical protein P9A27_gp02 [Hafnia phage yong1]|uniref:Uncharacterized protein n=1 Tax=Hafnia phage yong1 TaxID=2719181 RepID=A0A7D2LI11_9CAUD|nr:hypothetical protein P9A27_gp02 [Hafnia phage yong1]QIQ67948.1 hypothetical protein [Hafnia phage yong1]